MTALVRAEFRKLTTTRLWLWMLILGLAITGATTSAAIGFAEPGPLGLDTDAGQRTIFAQATASLVVVGILGIVAVTSEFVHQTATPTFLSMPRRGKVVGAKLITYAAVGLAYATACTAVVFAVALPWLASEDVHVMLTWHRSRSHPGGGRPRGRPVRGARRGHRLPHAQPDRVHRGVRRLHLRGGPDPDRRARDLRVRAVPAVPGRQRTRSAHVLS